MLFPTLAAGGSLIIPSRDSLMFPRFFFLTLGRERITHTSFSPSYLRMLLANPRLDTLASSALRVLGLGGEACRAADVARLWAAKPHLRVLNRYGPTETTIAASSFEVTREVIDRGGPVPIGVPNRGVSFYLLDQEDALIHDPGHIGELYIGGVQVMDGYWAAPQLTATVMRSDLIAGQTLYRTGDLVQRDDDGNYIYIDRADCVIKRNAIRISLVELSEVLSSLPGVTAATCATYDNNGQLGIAAFVVSPSGHTPQQLWNSAAELLPVLMLPDLITVVQSLPLASSSKVDERKLLADAGLSRPSKLIVTG
jgi:D-alanine--poly(phosphoribitol) ligase subunit 1